MKTFYIKSGIFILGILGVSTFQIHSSASGNSSPRTGAPNESTCTSCHTGTALQTSGNNHNKIKLSGNFTGDGYLPDSTYQIVLSYKESGKSKFGFMVTALNSNNTAAGTFNNLNSRTGTFSSTVSGSTRYYIEHSSQGTSSVASDSAAWVFEWTAPNSNVGDIKFYIALNVADNNGGTGGDVIYNKTVTLAPSKLLPKATASLKSSVVCTFAQNQFSASSTNSPTGYSWSFPGGVPSTSTDSTPLVQYPSTGARIAILKSFNSKGSSLNDTISFNVLIGASAPILNTNSNIVPLCEGDTASIEILPITNHSYTWNNGFSGTTLKTDTAGKFFAIASRSNGCKQSSREITVLSLKAPKFGVSYGSSGDSACIGEPLLIFTSDNNGFSDSYSITSKTGPYETDSFITKNLNLGLNSIKVWAKSVAGCISESNNKQITGTDTLGAPNVFISSKSISSVTFKWDAIRDLISYQYSTDQGKTWLNPSGGKTTDSQTIQLNDPYDKVEFWLKANTKYYCGVTRIAKTTGSGTGCQDINFDFLVNDSTPCFGDTVLFNIGKLNFNSGLSWQFDSLSISDTVISAVATKFKRYTASVIDSSQLACGYYSKYIDLRVNILEKPEFTFDSTLIEGCGKNTLIVPIKFENHNNIDTIWISSSKGSLTSSNSNPLNIQGVNNETFEFFYSSLENCQSDMSDAISLSMVDSLTSAFNIDWIDNFVYKFTSSIDTSLAIHEWRINDESGELLSMLSSFEFDFIDSANKNLTIFHSVQPKASINYSSPCKFYTQQGFSSNNLNSKYLRKSGYNLFPNPVKSGDKLSVNFEIENTQLGDCYLYDLNGRKIAQLSFVKNQILIPANLQEGIYLLEIQTNLGSIKTQVSLLSNEQ